MGDFNALLLDDLRTIPGAVGPHFVWEKIKEEEEENVAAGEGDSN